MEPYLVGCEVSDMVLRIPQKHVPNLLGYFDGMSRGEKGAARAQMFGRELRFEACGGRLVLILEGDVFVVSELDVFDDRSGDFFRMVILNLFVTYGGTLRCVTEWSASKALVGDRRREAMVEQGRCSWEMSKIRIGGWLAPSPAEHGQEQSEYPVEEILAKLEEAERCYAEYLRLRDQGEGRRKPGGHG